MTRLDWTPGKEARLRQLRERKHTPSMIAVQIGMSFAEVKTKLFELGIYRGRSGPSQPKKQTRMCLKCRQNFPSEGIGNRICERCRRATC